MTLTEEEAKTKLCQETISRSRPPGPCIGSACMAWRWHRCNAYQAIDESDKKAKGHANYADFIVMEGKGDYSATHGYCGKAGKP